MVAVAQSDVSTAWPKFAAWLPVATLPAAVAFVAADWPAWIFMWVLAVSIYGSLKWLTFVDSAAAVGAGVDRSLGYLLLWPGMDAEAFIASPREDARPRLAEWLLAGAKLSLGGVLVAIAANLVDRTPTLAAWIGLAGLAFVLHFGLFHLLSMVWRQEGIDAVPIMRAPALATSLGDFWGRRWNLAFRDVAHAYVFRPLVGCVGGTVATVAVFLVSGVIHDAVISIPAGGGYGLPTLYFAIQGVGVLLERSRPGKRIGLRRGLAGRLFCAAVTVGPVFLLFHGPFLERVIVPMLQFLGNG
jgi:hypothetical protein